MYSVDRNQGVGGPIAATEGAFLKCVSVVVLQAPSFGVRRVVVGSGCGCRLWLWLCAMAVVAVMCLVVCAYRLCAWSCGAVFVRGRVCAMVVCRRVGVVVVAGCVRGRVCAVVVGLCRCACLPSFVHGVVGMYCVIVQPRYGRVPGVAVYPRCQLR